MLDKSIPYKNILMKRRDKLPIVVKPLPEGFSLRFFRPGEEKIWADIETSVGEYDTVEEAESYFVKNYLPFLDELKKRCIFVVNPEGIPVGTGTAWIEQEDLQSFYSLHWLAVKPAYQGLGLGRALVGKVLSVFDSFGENPVYLHTQTWSHKAVLLYLQFGFRFIKAGSFAKKENDYVAAIEILETILTEKDWAYLNLFHDE